jgi:hypothetical protein
MPPGRARSRAWALWLRAGQLDVNRALLRRATGQGPPGPPSFRLTFSRAPASALEAPPDRWLQRPRAHAGGGCGQAKAVADAKSSSRRARRCARGTTAARARRRSGRTLTAKAEREPGQAAACAGGRTGRGHA